MAVLFHTVKFVSHTHLKLYESIIPPQFFGYQQMAWILYFSIDCNDFLTWLRGRQVMLSTVIEGHEANVNVKVNHLTIRS